MPPSSFHVADHSNKDDGVVISFDNSPAIGSTYRGSTVVDVKEEVSDNGTRVRKRLIVTLDSGAILIENHYKDKVFQELDTRGRRRAPVNRPRSSQTAGQTSAVSQQHSSSTDVSTAPIARKHTADSAHNNRLPAAPAPTPTPARGLPTSKSGRHLPMAPPSSRGSIKTPRRLPPGHSKSSNLDEMRLSSSSSHSQQSSNSGSCQHPPESPGSSSSNKPSSLRNNISNFLTSPKKRRGVVATKSGNDLDALRNSLHSTMSRESSHRNSSDGIEMENSSSSLSAPSSPEKTQKKPGSLRKLFDRSPGGTTTRKPPVQGNCKSGGRGGGGGDKLRSMQEQIGLPCLDNDGSKDNIGGGDKPTTKDRRRSSSKKTKAPTAESNREKLRSFKELISLPSPSSKKKPTVTIPSMGTAKNGQRRRSSTASTVITNIAHSPTAISHDTAEGNYQRGRVQDRNRTSVYEREASMSPERSDDDDDDDDDVLKKKKKATASTTTRTKNSGSSNYLTSVLDSLYDSYMGGDMNDGSDDDSDGPGFGRGQGLLESSLNRFVEWAE